MGPLELGGGAPLPFLTPALRLPAQEAPRPAAGGLPANRAPTPQTRRPGFPHTTGCHPQGMGSVWLGRRATSKETQQRTLLSATEQHEVGWGQHGSPGHTEAVGGGRGRNRVQRTLLWAWPVNGGSKASNLASDGPTACNPHQGFPGVPTSSTPGEAAGTAPSACTEPHGQAMPGGANRARGQGLLWVQPPSGNLAVTPSFYLARSYKHPERLCSQASDQN